MGNSDSHAAFVDGVKRLLVEDVREDEREFWSSLFTAPMSVEDIFEIVSPDHVRQLRQRRPQNLQALLRRTAAAMAEVCSAVDDGGLPAPLATTANTAVRLLTRVVPFLLEDQEDSVMAEILWRPGGYRGPEPLEDDVPEQTVTGHDILYHIGRFLFLPGYTITPRTTMVGKERGPVPTHRVDDRVVWKGGVGVAAQISGMPGQAYSKARCEVLRCVLACLSGPLFQSAEEYQERPPTWLLRFTGGEVCHTANLFCSLMSTVFSYDPVGWGVPYGGYFGSGTEEELVDVSLQVLCVVMDFDPREDDAASPDAAAAGSNVVKAKLEEGECEYVVDNSQLQAASHGLGYRLSQKLEDLDSSKTALWGSTVCGREVDGEWVKVQEGLFLPMSLNGKPVLVQKATTSPKKKLRNVYRFMLQNIHKEAEIDLIFGGIVRLLSTMHQANQTYLPNSRRSVGFYQEALVLLWHLVTLNPTFTRRVVDHLDTNQIVLPVLYLLHQAQNAPQLVGLLHTASFVLLVLSSERSFAVRLNEPYASKVPLSIPAFQGCHADVVALTLHKVISDSLPKPQNDALVEMLLTVLCNVSPYVKAFALESCLKLLSLIDRCARPAYLFRSAFTHHGLVFLVEMINNIIQYQFEGNSMLVYSVLRQKEVFQHLAELRLPASGRQASQGSHTPAAAGGRASPSDAQPAGAEAPGAEAAAEGSAGEADGEAADAAEESEDAAWAPTEAWLAGVKKKLPLQAILCLVDFLAPQIESLCKKNDVTDQDEVLKYLKQTTMVGILPVPHPIVIRTYQASSYTAMWFTSYMWGVIFTRSQRMPLYDWKKIRLVIINQ